MRIVVVYRKNLKMSEGKVASQVAHAVKNIGYETPIDVNIAVLKVSDNKFCEYLDKYHTDDYYSYCQIDKGLTEVSPNTATAFAFIEF